MLAACLAVGVFVCHPIFVRSFVQSDESFFRFFFFFFFSFFSFRSFRSFLRRFRASWSGLGLGLMKGQR